MQCCVRAASMCCKNHIYSRIILALHFIAKLNRNKPWSQHLQVDYLSWIKLVAQIQLAPEYGREVQQRKLTDFFLLSRYSQVRNQIRFFSFWGDERVPYNAGNTAGFSMYHRSILRLDAFSNTTINRFGIWTLNLMTSPTLLSTRPPLADGYFHFLNLVSVYLIYYFVINSTMC